MKKFYMRGHFLPLFMLSASLCAEQAQTVQLTPEQQEAQDQFLRNAGGRTFSKIA